MAPKTVVEISNGLTMALADGVLKELYVGQKVADLTLQDHPFIGTIKKRDDYGGDYIPIPMRKSRPGGRSATFANAKANAKSSAFDRFLVTVVDNYQVFNISGRSMEMMDKDVMAFIDASTAEIDAAWDTLVRDASRNAFRSHDGMLCQYSSISGQTIILTNKEDIFLFEDGMTIKSAQGDPSVKATWVYGNETSVDTDANTALITGINHRDGILTVTGTISGWVNAVDYLYVDGDWFGKMYGLEDHAPTTVTSATFYNVNRATNDNLAGHYFDASSYSLPEGLVRAVSSASQRGAKIKRIWMNPQDYTLLDLALGLKINYNNEIKAVDANGPVASINFQGIVIQAGNTHVEILQDADCQLHTAWGVEPDALTLISAGDFPKFAMHDGLRLMRQSDADGYEGRLLYRANIYTDHPVGVCRIGLPT